MLEVSHEWGSVFFSDENVTGTAAAAVAGAWLDWMLAGPVLEGHTADKASDNSMVHASTNPIQ